MSWPGQDANKKFTDDYNNVKAAQSNSRQLVAIIFDIKDSRTYPNVKRLEKIASGLNEYISCIEIDESIFEIIENGGDDNA